MSTAIAAVGASQGLARRPAKGFAYRSSHPGLGQSPMKIAIDARAIHFPGIGRYIRELITHLAMIDISNQYIIYFSSKVHMAKNMVDKPNFRSVLIKPKIYTALGQIHLPYHLYKDKIDIFHATTSLDIPLVQTCRLVVTFHDLLLKRFSRCLPSTAASV